MKYSAFYLVCNINPKQRPLFGLPADDPEIVHIGTSQSLMGN